MKFSKPLIVTLALACMATACGDDHDDKTTPVEEITKKIEAPKAAPVEKAIDLSKLPDTPSGIADSQDVVVKFISIQNADFSDSEVYLYGTVERKNYGTGITMGWTGSVHGANAAGESKIVKTLPKLKNIKLWGRTLNNFMRNATDEKFAVKIELFKNEWFDDLVMSSTIDIEKIKEVAASETKSKIFSMTDENGAKVEFEISIQNSEPVEEFHMPLGPKI